MQRRVEVAKGVLHRPRLMIMDELTNEVIQFALRGGFVDGNQSEDHFSRFR
jgi:hypothetical protein